MQCFNKPGIVFYKGCFYRCIYSTSMDEVILINRNDIPYITKTCVLFLENSPYNIYIDLHTARLLLDVDDTISNKMYLFGPEKEDT